MRKLTKTLAVMSLLAPASAYSLGIGSIKVHSGLNQNLNAEISLVASANEDLSNISVNLAPPAKFDEAKVPWAFFLSKIKFEPVIRPNGSAVIKVTSTEALKEPFLDFLLEVNWTKGSLYRQFTVLLEPPQDYQKTAVSHVHDYQKFEAAPAEYRPRATTSTKHRRRTPAVQVIHDSGRSTVTKSHDTLWEVAERVKTDDNVSVEQMMMALYEANPQAFYQNNINALLPNKTLKIPAQEDVSDISRKQALNQFNEQMRAWKKNAPVITQEDEAIAPPPPVERRAAKQLTLAAPTEAIVAEDAATSLTTPPTPPVAPAPTAEAKPKEGDAHGQSGESKTGVNVVGADQNAKTDKMLELEKQLSALQKDLSLKEQQLNSLQNSGKPPLTPQAVVQPEKTQPVPVVNIPELPKPVPTVVPPAPGTPGEQTPNPYLEAPTPDTSYLWFAGIGGSLLSLLGWLWWRKRKFDEQFDGESMFAPSSMIKPSNASAKTSNKTGAASTSAIASSSLEENSFLNEFTASDFEVFDTSHVEIDPISETDVYLAYGRYQQAEELMRQAIKDQPDNDEYKLKLLEIFCATERKKDFVNYTTELADAGKKDQAEFWAKVIEMGAEVWSDLKLSANADNDLFGTEQDTPTNNIYTALTLPEEKPAEPVAPEEENTSNEMTFDIATFDTAFVDTLMGAENNPFATGNFDAESEFASAVNLDTDAVDSELQNNNSIDFDLGALSSTDTKIKSESTPAYDLPTKTSPSLSLDKPDFLLEDTDEIEISAFNPPEKDEPSLGEFDLDSLLNTDDDFDLAHETSGKTASAMSLDDNKASYDITDDFDFDLDFNLVKPSHEAPDEHYFDDNEQHFDFIDLDEMETKLDLAKAYIDMGDSDAAKEIIAEVLDKGNAEQIKTARHLFDSLAAE